MYNGKLGSISRNKLLVGFVIVAMLFSLIQFHQPMVSSAFSSEITNYPLEDTFVQKNNPDTTNGHRIDLRVWKGNEEGLIKFDSTNLNNVISAELRIYNYSVASSRTIAVYGVDPDSWTEAAATWNTRPTPDTSMLDSVLIPVSTGQYNVLDVTDYVQGHDDDTIAFQLQVLENHMPTGIQSRTGANPPMLVVTVGSETPTVGWSQLKPSEDSVVIYVSNSDGNDGNDGLSPETPVQSITQARTLVRDGYPDWIVLKRGDVWIDQNVGAFINGRSAAEPAVIAYYGDSGARPLIKTSWLVNTNGNERNYQAYVGLHIVNYRMDPNDPGFTNNNHSGGMRFVGGGDFLLVDDCKLEYGEIIVQEYNTYHHTNMKLLRNIVVDNYRFGTTTSDSFKPSGLFASGVDGLEIIENVFDHNGWNQDFPNTLANQFNHNMYIQYDNVGNQIKVQGNIVTRGSSHGVHGRPGGLYEDNLFVGNSIGLQMGYDGHPLASGTFAIARNNVILNGKRMLASSTSAPQTTAVYGLFVADIGQGSFAVENNIAANRLESGTNVGIGNLAGVTYTDNIQYNWGGGIGDMYSGLIGDWNDPSRSVGSYHATLGKTATLESFLEEARNRELGEWMEEYTAYAVNDYIRAGFEEVDTGTRTRYSLEDTYVQRNNPDSTYGNRSDIKVWKGNEEGLIKFDSRYLDNVISAKLRIYNNNVASARTVAVYGVDPESWTEYDVTWNTRPTPDTTMLDSVLIPVNTGQYNELDVTDYVSGHTGDTISFQLQILENHMPTGFHSRTGTHAPMLIVTVDSE